MTTMPATRRMRRMIVGALLLLVAALYGRMLLGARQHLQRARRAGSVEGRVRELRRSVAFYAPGNPWVSAAVEALAAEARAAEAGAEPARARRTWRALRAAVIATRSVYQPFAEMVREASTRIAALEAARAETARHLRGEAGRKRHRALLVAPRGPREVWVGLGLAGFCLWVGGAFLFVFSGLTENLAVVRRRGARALVMSAAGLLLFFTGLALA